METAQPQVSRKQHLGQRLTLLGLVLLWMSQNMQETFNGTIALGSVQFALPPRAGLLLVLTGTVILVTGAIWLRGAWTHERRPPYLLACAIAVGILTSTIGSGITRRLDTFIAWHIQRSTLRDLADNAPRGLTGEECYRQANLPWTPGVVRDSACTARDSLGHRVTGPADDSLANAYRIGDESGYFQVEVQPPFVAFVETRSHSRAEELTGFVHLRPGYSRSALPHELFSHRIKELYPVEKGWFHFATD